MYKRQRLDIAIFPILARHFVIMWAAHRMNIGQNIGNRFVSFYLLTKKLDVYKRQAQELARKQMSNAQLKYAMIIFTTLPVLFTYPFFQKYFVKGVMLGSLKE